MRREPPLDNPVAPFNSIRTLSLVKYTRATSSRPSPLKSPTAVSRGRSTQTGQDEITEVKTALPSLANTIQLLSRASAVNRSRSPS